MTIEVSAAGEGERGGGEGAEASLPTTAQK